MTGLDREDCMFILTSLKYTRDRFEAYDYPTREVRRSRLDDVDSVITKVRAFRASLPKE